MAGVCSTPYMQAPLETAAGGAGHSAAGGDSVGAVRRRGRGHGRGRPEVRERQGAPAITRDQALMAGRARPACAESAGGALRMAHGTDYLTRRTQGKGIVNSKSRGIRDFGVVTLARPGVRAGVILLRSREVQVLTTISSLTMPSNSHSLH